MNRNMTSVRELRDSLLGESAHEEQVCKLALMLFDELNALHSLKAADSELLEAASLLHDIGWAISGSKHHKHSRDMILNYGIAGWSKREVLLIANIARYHRKAFPADSHSQYAALSPAEKVKVSQLSSLLRLADGLDRSHTNAVQRIGCEWHANEINLTLHCRGNCDAEIYGFEKKRDLFEFVYGRNIRIEKLIEANI
ncbi:HD domain-containing protein [candidate division KSB1 bacterium]|nr:HD domain-containing protein [candidate division KSB1 bacterium]